MEGQLDLLMIVEGAASVPWRLPLSASWLGATPISESVHVRVELLRLNNVLNTYIDSGTDLELLQRQVQKSG